MISTSFDLLQNIKTLKSCGKYPFPFCAYRNLRDFLGWAKKMAQSWQSWQPIGIESPQGAAYQMNLGNEQRPCAMKARRFHCSDHTLWTPVWRLTNQEWQVLGRNTPKSLMHFVYQPFLPSIWLDDPLIYIHTARGERTPAKRPLPPSIYKHTYNHIHKIKQKNLWTIMTSKSDTHTIFTCVSWAKSKHVICMLGETYVGV